MPNSMDKADLGDAMGQMLRGWWLSWEESAERKWQMAGSNRGAKTRVKGLQKGEKDVKSA